MTSLPLLLFCLGFFGKLKLKPEAGAVVRGAFLRKHAVMCAVLLQNLFNNGKPEPRADCGAAMRFVFLVVAIPDAVEIFF